MRILMSMNQIKAPAPDHGPPIRFLPAIGFNFSPYQISCLISSHSLANSYTHFAALQTHSFFFSPSLSVSQSNNSRVLHQNSS